MLTHADVCREGGGRDSKRRRVCVLRERQKTQTQSGSDKGALARSGARRASVCAAPGAASPAGTQFACFTGTKIQILTQSDTGALASKASVCEDAHVQISVSTKKGGKRWEKKLTN